MGNGAPRPLFEDTHASGEDFSTPNFEDVLADISTTLVRVAADQISAEIDLGLRHIVLALGIDRATIGKLNPATAVFYVTHGWAREGVLSLPRAMNVSEPLPWLVGKVLADEPVVLSRVEEAPPEAAKDREFARIIGTKSCVVIPLKIGGVTVGAVSFAAVTRERTWPARTVQRLRLIAELFGSALERERTVTEVCRLREEMRQTSELAMMGELTASLAHELNQPLGAILSNAQAARRFLAAKKRNLAEVKAAIEEIIRDNSRAVETLRNVRALFQRDKRVEMSPVDLRQILLEVERSLRLEAKSKGISMRLDLPPSLAIVVGNHAQLLEVLMNLAANAFDSICGSGGGPRLVELCARHSETGHVQVAVRDSGTGIDPEAMPRLFDAFFTTKPHGTGIGLRIVRSIVQGHGGRLWATNNADRGATFTFELPVKNG